MILAGMRESDMDKLPPVICGACGMEFEDSDAATNAHLHILREHPIDVESSKPTPTFDKEIEKILIKLENSVEHDIRMRYAHQSQRAVSPKQTHFKAVQSVHQAVVELIKGAKPSHKPDDMTVSDVVNAHDEGFNNAADQYEHNLMEKLGSTK